MRSQKVFDIIPPTERDNLAIERELERPESGTLRTSLNLRKNRFGLGLPIVIIAGAIFGSFFIEPWAEVTVWPKTQTQNFNTKITLGVSTEKFDLSAGILPAEIIEADAFVSEEFPASGKAVKEGKAQGIITVYNNYSTNSQPLISGTRFVSAEGKLFRIQDKVTVPGAHYEKGKLIAGTIDIKLVADQPGEEYNIGPSTFSIPGFVGTAKYTSFYGKSFSAMEGGFKKESLQVTQEDLDKAQKRVSEKVIIQSQESLEQKITGEIAIIRETITKEVVDISPLAKASQEAENFVVQARGKSRAIAFKKADLNNFVREFVKSQLPPDNRFLEKSIAVEYSPKEASLDQRKAVLDVDIAARTYLNIDQDSLKQELLNNDSSTVSQDILDKHPYILKIKFKFLPFWTTKFPKDPNRIKIGLSLD